MPRKQLASLLVIVVWVATFAPFGSSVYHPTQGDVEELGGEKQQPVDEPKREEPPPDPDEED
jgi:hypothetical protein